MSALETPNTPLSDEAKQAIRLRRFLLATLTYVVAAGLLLFANAIDLMPALPTATALVLMVLANVLFFAIFHSGVNLRFADPSLTLPQVLFALALQMYIIYNMDNGRGLALVFTFIVFQFGVYRLSRREFVTLILYTLAGYALVVNLIMYQRPQAVQSVYLEWFSWLLLALVLPGFGLMGGKISEMRSRLCSSHAELSAAFETIHRMATRDSLTDLHNRAALTDALHHALAQSERHGRGVAVFFMDLDHFKAINDTLGHSVGDRVSREVADRLKRVTRESDIVARLGGDEFVVVAEGVQSVSGLEVIARKIVEVVAQPLRLEDRDLPLSISVGIAAASQDARDVHTLLRNGDAAMYHAKQQGRNGYANFSAGMHAAGARRTIPTEPLATTSPLPGKGKYHQHEQLDDHERNDAAVDVHGGDLGRCRGAHHRDQSVVPEYACERHQQPPEYPQAQQDGERGPDMLEPRDMGACHPHVDEGREDDYADQAERRRVNRQRPALGKAVPAPSSVAPIAPTPACAKPAPAGAPQSVAFASGPLLRGQPGLQAKDSAARAMAADWVFR